MSCYIPQGQPCTPHIKEISLAFDSHLALAMGALEPGTLRQFRTVTKSLSRRKITFGDAWSCWTALLRGFDRAHAGHALLHQFLNIPRGSYTTHTWRHPDTGQLILEVNRTTARARARQAATTRTTTRKKRVLRILDEDPCQVPL